MIKRIHGKFDYSSNKDKPFSVQQQEFEETLRKANSKDPKSFVETMQAKQDVGEMYFWGYGCESSRINSFLWKQEWRADYIKMYGRPTGSSSDCFITTAVCESFGKADDCFELTAFRKFRDGWLSAQPDGKNLIAEYYSIAPQIVNKINQLKDAAQIYQSIWQKYLEPCLNFIRSGDNLACKEKYVEMVRELKRKYL